MVRGFSGKACHFAQKHLVSSVTSPVHMGMCEFIFITKEGLRGLPYYAIIAFAVVYISSVFIAFDRFSGVCKIPDVPLFLIIIVYDFRSKRAVAEHIAGDNRRSMTLPAVRSQFQQADRVLRVFTKKTSSRAASIINSPTRHPFASVVPLFSFHKTWLVQAKVIPLSF